MSDPRRSARAWLVNGLLSAVAFGLLGATIYSNRADLREALAGPLDLRLLAVAFGVYLAGVMLTFVRWFVLVRALGLPFRVRDALRLGFIGSLFNLVIPGAVGGDVVKAAFLCREQARKTQAVASMVIDRVVGLLGLFVLAGLSGAWAWADAGSMARRLIVMVWIAVAAGVLGLGVLFTPALYEPLTRLVRGRGKLEAIVRELGRMASAYRARLATVAGTLVMSMGSHSLFVVAFYLVSLALFRGHLPTLAQHFLMVPLTIFTTAVPLPFGAMGVSEQASQQLFDLVHHPRGAVAMMGFRVLMYATGVVSALVYLANLGQVRTLAHPASTPDDLAPAGPALGPVPARSMERPTSVGSS